MVAVTEKPSTSPGVVRFELNRALTGMGHEHFTSAADAFGPRPAAELARRLFATGQAAAVHVYANIVTVDLAKGASSDRPGRRRAPPVPVLAAGDGAADVRGPAARGGARRRRVRPAATGDGEGDAALAEAAKRVPMHLLERGRAARERWKAKAG